MYKLLNGTTQVLPRIPAPSHRHGTPSGPWPFLDIDSELELDTFLDEEHNDGRSTTRCTHPRDGQDICWCKYPQSLFPNWTPAQQRKSKILKIVEKASDPCKIHYINVLRSGEFVSAKYREFKESTTVFEWRYIQQERPKDIQIQALFIENLSGPVLQMIGTRYCIEPFFFSSSLGWIPSRFQENVVPTRGDHITITLPFIRTRPNLSTVPGSPAASILASTISKSTHLLPDMVIDTQAPLFLRSSDLILVHDFLSLHMIRSHEGSTIISYHPPPEHRATSAKTLWGRFHAAGRSVYWSNIISASKDPTFVFLSLLWYPLYAWDETLEELYTHICWLESQIITNDILLTRELHVMSANLLHYASLLEDFKKTIIFISSTPYPALENPELFTTEEKGKTHELLSRECKNLLAEIERLEKSREMQDKRLRNVMNLGFSSVNIQDSRQMQKLTEAAVRDSAAIKQISYITMIFLPPSFVAAVFGMNVGEINPGTYGTLPHYLAAALPLTALTIWIITAYEMVVRTRLSTSRSALERKGFVLEDNGNPGTTQTIALWRKLLLPAAYIIARISKQRSDKMKGIII